MKDIDSLLNDYKETGITDSEGAFTIDFARAREKMARFQLPDPHHLFLKFVQAANLAGHAISIQTRGQLQVTITGWNPKYRLEQLAGSLTSATLQHGNDPLSHLSTGLYTLVGLASDPVTVCQRSKDDGLSKVLEIGEGLELTQSQDTVDQDALIISTSSFPSPLKASSLNQLLKERCAISQVPIRLNGKETKSDLPTTSGKHRLKYFRANTQLAARVWSPHRKAKWLPEAFRNSRTTTGTRLAWLNLTVDFDDRSPIWMSQAGVMLELQRFNLKVPGVSGIVSADDLKTDLTGTQFTEGPEMHELTEWLILAARQLRDEAVSKITGVMAEGQPPAARAPMRERDGCLGCVIGIAGLYLTTQLYPHLPLPPAGEALIMGNIYFWMAVSFAYPAYHLWRHGAAKDVESDAKARQHIIEILQASQWRDT